MTWLALAWSVLKRAFALARAVPWQVYAGFALVVALATVVSACGATPTPRMPNRGNASDGNPLGPSYVLVPLPGEDDSLLGRCCDDRRQLIGLKRLGVQRPASPSQQAGQHIGRYPLTARQQA